MYSDADATAPHVARRRPCGRLRHRQSYLSIDEVIAAARATGAQAIHPGYGFLSENTAFAAACDDAGIAFVGPPASAIDAMGDKIRAKQTVAKAGVPVVPGSDGAGLSDAELAAAVAEVGYPVLLKPSAGGGGKGMREVHRAEELAAAIATARREARSSFGDDTLLVERLVTTPRHIEIQVMADTHGNVVHLGERECSLQRRHQKIVEEAPSPLLTPEQREAMGAAAVEAAQSVGYAGAGTVEFIVGADRPDEFFFMEMNTRLQVEHPVTEEVNGVDLVELQLRVAAGEDAPWPGDVEAARARDRGPRLRRGPGGRLPADRRADPRPRPAGHRARRLRRRRGRHRRQRLRPDARQGHRARPRPRRGAAPPRRRAARHRAARPGHQHRFPARPARRSRRRRGSARHRPRRPQASTTGWPRRCPPTCSPRPLPIACSPSNPTGAVVDPFDVPGGWRVGGPAWTHMKLTVGRAGRRAASAAAPPPPRSPSATPHPVSA